MLAYTPSSLDMIHTCVKTNLDFTEARDSEWQWYQLGHMQLCTSLQTDKHASTPTTQFFTGWMPFLPPNQQCQSTEGKLDMIHYNTNVNKNTCESVCQPVSTAVRLSEYRLVWHFTKSFRCSPCIQSVVRFSVEPL